jgi:Domain of unknown function (DUF4893)
MRLLAGVLAVFMGLATAALGDGEVDGLLTPADQQKLAAFNTTRMAALREAEAGSAEDRAVLTAALAGDPQSFTGFDPVGNWSCRVIKLGGLLPLTVYPKFRCTITEDGKGWLLAKTTGSQRTTGYFYQDSDTRLIYLGSGYVQGEKPKPYGAGVEFDQVAYAERLSERKIVLLFPKPYYESNMDLLVLEGK